MRYVEFVHANALVMRYTCEPWEFAVPGILSNSRHRELSRNLYGREYALHFTYLPPTSQPTDTGYVSTTTLTVHPAEGTETGGPAYRDERQLPIVLEWRCFVDTVDNDQ